ANRKWDKALASYEKAASLAPRMFEARHLAAEVRAARRDFAGAVEAETAALAIAPGSAIAAKKLAEYKAAHKPVDETDEKVDEDAFTQYYQTAVRLRNEGRTAEAAAQLDQAIALRPNASLLLTKARWVADTDPKGALEAAKRASAAGSDEAWYWIGALEQRAGRTGNAVAAYEAYLARNPGGSYAGEAQNALAKLKGP
ncbi:MAG: tetratricopeptide repeat protein, partial [Deltaproteobacteria bacterium]|nr:tetratricopeptide repeat protein [Deltaproteobacteria bacterium]